MRIGLRADIGLHLIASSVLYVLVAAGCASPRGSGLTQDTEPYPDELVEGARRPANELEVEILEEGDAVGARIVFGIEGEPEDVLEMLLDFDHADGRRAWSRKHELVSRNGECAEARWHLKGKSGIQPTVRLGFVTEREADRIRLEFALVERAFGVAQLFGDYTIAPDEEHGGSLLAGRVFIASGLPFGGPTGADIAGGMRKDARLTREWMRERLLAR
jgi:hypothetical protein